MNIWSKILLTLTLFLFATLVAVSAIVNDSTKVEVRYPGTEKLHQYKSERAFDYYKVPPEESDSLLDRILRAIFDFLINLFSDKGAYPYLRYAIVAALFVVVIMNMMKINVWTWFYSSEKNGTLAYGDESGDIRAMDIDQLIADAKARQDYKVAIRYLFLKLLKLYDTHRYIVWRQDKTNLDYLNEISNQRIQTNFRHLTYIYNYIWYGDFAPRQDVFVAAEGEFLDAFAAFATAAIAPPNAPTVEQKQVV